MKILNSKGSKLFAVMALCLIANTAFIQPAKADDWRHDDWHHDHWHDRAWHRHHPGWGVYQPGVVYAPAPVVYAPPPPSPGINLVVPLNFR